MRLITQLQRLADFVAGAAPHVDPPPAEHFTPPANQRHVAGPSSERPSATEMAAPAEATGDEPSLHPPTSAAGVAEDFFDGIVRRVEGDR